MDKTKIEFKCDRCGKGAGCPPAYTINVYSKYDLSILGQEFHFCQDCYREIFKVMTGSNQIQYYPVYVYPKKDQ